jgi:signal transduction histidine kinase
VEDHRTLGQTDRQTDKPSDRLRFDAMPALSFRKRILLAMLVFGVLPTVVGIIGWAYYFRNQTPAIAGRLAFEEVGTTGRHLLRTLDTTRLSEEEREVLREHAVVLNRNLRLAQRAEPFSEFIAIGLTIVILVMGSGLIYVSVVITRSLSRQLSAPIDELVGWTGYLRRGEPLPSTARRRGAPEFAALREAFRDTAAEIHAARAAELESERLRAFREVARRVAHEMKNPLTPVRLAIRQLEQSAPPEQKEALEVLTTESARLEQLAREFATLGRLPEGPSAEVDLGELMAELLRTSVPETVATTLAVEQGTPRIVGHYDPLRRAFGNLIRNGVEAMGGSGRLDVRISRRGSDVVVSIADHGPGIPPEKRQRVFEPYYTEKLEGTGLGLSIVKQAVDHHRGTIRVVDTPGGGATFQVSFPGPVTSEDGNTDDRTDSDR